MKALLAASGQQRSINLTLHVFGLWGNPRSHKEHANSAQNSPVPDLLAVGEPPCCHMYIITEPKYSSTFFSKAS